MTTAIRMQPADQVSVRRNNLSLVLRLLHERGPRSRAAVAAATGLNKATVSSLVAELIDRGLVREVGTDEQRRLGRPATLLQLDGRNVVALGIELNVDFLDVLATDLSGEALVRRQRTIDAAGQSRQRTLTSLISLARQALDEVRTPATTLAGVTLAVPGLVDVGEGMIRLAPNLHWTDVEVRDRIVKALSLSVPMSVDNDGNLGALAEYRVGEFAGTPNLIFVSGQTGVGGGIIVDGHLLRGARGFSSEVGHMRMATDGPLCGCGRPGCWEALIGLKPLLHDALPDRAADIDAPDAPPEVKIREIVCRAEAGDQRALEALTRNGEWLGRGLATLVNLFNPEVVVLGGFFRDIAPWVLPVADAIVRKLTLAPDAGGCRIVVSRLPFSAAALGGAIHAAERVFDDPALVPFVTP
jgi:predicted NBD/HSP70 family sugar kinase